MVLMVVLLVPTGLVFASQDAVPGDRTYPIKRGLENVIVTLASVHPATRAFFKADMSKRRYKEAVALVKRGDTESQSSLVELVAQTEAAAEDIGQISDPKAKQELVENLSRQIDEYQTGLTKLETQSDPLTQATQPYSPSLSPVVQPTSAPIAQPTPVTLPTPTSVPQVVNRPLPVPPTPVVPATSIRSTINNLGEINDKLRNLSKEIEKDKKKEKDERRPNKVDNDGSRSSKDSGGDKKKFDK